MQGTPRRQIARRAAARAPAPAGMRSRSARAPALITALRLAPPQADSTHLVLELCATDLSRLLAACYAPLPQAVAKGIMQQLLTGLAAAHAAGMRGHMHGRRRGARPPPVAASYAHSWRSR